MTKQMDDIVDRIFELPANSRAYLAEILLESLDYEEDFIINEEWREEIKRRCHEIDEGRVKLISGDEGLAQLQRKYS